MKIFFSVVLVLNLLMEAMAAIMLISNPEAQGEALATATWARNYGFAALAIASASIWPWPARDRLAAVTPVAGTLLVFHVGLTISLSLAGGENLGPAGLHGVMALLFAVSFALRSKWCS